MQDWNVFLVGGCLGVCVSCFLVRAAQHSSTGPDNRFLRDEIWQLETQLEQKEKELTELKKEMGKEKKTIEEVWTCYTHRIMDSVLNPWMTQTLVHYSFVVLSVEWQYSLLY